MAATNEQFKATMLPLYREMIATATEIQREGSAHRTHLRLALQLIENATDAWWDAARGSKDEPVTVALNQTFSVAQCTNSCFGNPKSIVRTSGIFG